MGNTLRLKDGLWLLEAEPHILIRAKRVLGKANRNQFGFVSVSDTTDTARDLEWFCQRYPIEIIDKEYLVKRASQHREEEELVSGFLDHVRDVPKFDLAIPPRDYQRFAAAMALATGGMLLADDIGIGKTCSAICTFMAQGTLPALVVTMTHLPVQWQKEIAKFAPNLNTHVLKNGPPYDLTRLGRKNRNRVQDAKPFPDVIIANYHKLPRWAETLQPIVKTVIFDECQELRTGARTHKYAAAEHVAKSSRLRLGLSATPVYNYGGEFWNITNVLRPGVLGTQEEFAREWGHAIRNSVLIDDPRSFGAYARRAGIMLRRTRSEVGSELPPLQNVSQVVEANEEELDRVGSACDELAKMILSQAAQRRGAQWHASEEFSNALRQATGIAKAHYVAAFVSMLVECGESVVLFGWHREVYNIWMDRLLNYKPVLFTGSESATQKQRAADDFKSGKSKVLIMSLRAGQGLDGLQGHCRTVCFGELDWSPGVHEQCTGRVYRDGQKDPVIAYYLVAESGADPVMSDVLGVKLGQLDGIRDPNAPAVKAVGVPKEHVKRLAEDYARRRGFSLPQAEPETPGMEQAS